MTEVSACGRDRLGGRLEHGDVGVRVDANLAGDREGLLHDLGGREGRLTHEGAGGGLRVGTAGPDGENAVVGLDEFPVAAQHEAMIDVGHNQHGFEPTEHAIAAPLLRQFHRRFRQVARKAIELFLELLEEGDRIGHGAGEAGDHAAALEGADLHRLRLRNGVAHRHLPVAANGHASVATYRENGGSSDDWKRHI